VDEPVLFKIKEKKEKERRNMKCKVGRKSERENR
jgi:hypothetical protein